MRLILRWCVAALLLAGAAWLWSENRRLASTLDATARARRETGAREEALRGEVRRLEHELGAALAARESVLEVIDERSAALVERREHERALLRRATKAPPEGVRLALLALNELLAADGFGTIRLLYGGRIADQALHEVELTEHRPERFSTAVWTAARLELELDRASGVLVLRFFDGEVFADGEARAFPADGELIRLEAVDGAAWEARLPFLVRAHGSYPRDDGAEAARPAIDPATAAIWAERLDRLLERAPTEPRLRVGRIRDLREARFRGVLLHGYDDGKVLASSMSAESLEVRVDTSGDTVELVLRDGVLLQRGGETPIPATGHRILLPGVTVGMARDLMLGMVVDA